MAHAATIPDAAALVRFHTQHKLLLMAHSPAALNSMGRLVAAAGERPIPFLLAEYMKRFHLALAQPATRGGHVNALQHMVGYLRRAVSDDERQEIADAIAAFASGRSPLSSALTIIRRHAASHRIAYLLDQVYLDASPAAGAEA